MRKFLKNNILEIFKTIYEAHGIVKGFIDKKEYESAQNLLADCQDTAIQLGNLIEESEGEGFITVSFLEEYCEALYEAATSLSEESNGYKVQKQLDKKIIKAENSAKNDIKIKLEIVFMPYKASMWDSLESVWKAADEDPNCDAYVVPIPYYDRKPDHSFGEFHYEGGEYPDYVPVMHYEMYNLEQRRPDVIYIHNPYDGNNYVTSVDPRFYSSELKKYTECLVYIPYYLAYGSIGEGQRMTSTYNYADYIVIQNESYRRFFYENIPDAKFLSLGSPKFDKVINMCKNQQQLPDGWGILDNKKVFFYNLTICEMLSNTELFLKKMLYVFKTFDKYKDSVCLLWRPHPLLESTFKSMRPMFYDNYIALKNLFLSLDIGVYDNNPDINLSIALSDVYIGDSSSSIVSSFSAVGKPIFILSNMNNSLPYGDRKFCVQCFRDNSDVRYPIINGNTLLYSPLNDFVYDKELKLSEKKYYAKCIAFDKKVYVCPGNAKDIVVVDTETKSIYKRIKIASDNDATCFATAVSDDRYICLIPNSQGNVVIYDTITEKVISVSEKIYYVTKCSHYRNNKGCCIVNKNLYISSPDENILWKYDIEKEFATLIKIDVPNSKGFVSMRSDGNNIWMISHIGVSVIRWNPENGETKIYSEMPSDLECKDLYFGCSDLNHAFSDMIITEKYVYLIPATGNMTLKINKVPNDITKWNTGISGLCESNNCYAYSYKKTWLVHSDTDKSYYMVSAYTGKLYSIDINSDEVIINEEAVEFDDSLLSMNVRGFMFNPIYNKYCCIENEMNTLEDCVTDNIKMNSHDKVKQLEFFSSISNNLDGTCGEKIHSCIKSYLQ